MDSVDWQEVLKKKKPFKGYNKKIHARTGGLSAKGRAKFKREQGSNLKPPVTTKPSKLKEAAKQQRGVSLFVQGQEDLNGQMELIAKKQEPPEEGGIVESIRKP